LAGDKQRTDGVNSGASLNQASHILKTSPSSRHDQKKIEIQNNELILLSMSDSNANDIIVKETSEKENIHQPDDPYIHNSTVLYPNRPPIIPPSRTKEIYGVS